MIQVADFSKHNSMPFSLKKVAVKALRRFFFSLLWSQFLKRLNGNKKTLSKLHRKITNYLSWGQSTISRLIPGMAFLLRILETVVVSIKLQAYY